MVTAPTVDDFAGKRDTYLPVEVDCSLCENE